MSAQHFCHFVKKTKTTQPGPQVSLVNGSIWQFISWLWWIMCVVFPNQKQGNILNEQQYNLNWHQADFLQYIWCYECIRDWDFLFVRRELPVFYFVFTFIIDILDAWNIYMKVLSETLLMSTKSVAIFNFIPTITVSSPYSIIFVLYKHVSFFLFFFWISILCVIVRNSFYQSALMLNGKITPQKHFKTSLEWNHLECSLQCRRILGGWNLVCVRNVVVAAIFDFMTVEDWGE